MPGSGFFWIFKLIYCCHIFVCPEYITAVNRWFAKLLPYVRPHLYSNGGPVIMAQVRLHVVFTCNHGSGEIARCILDHIVIMCCCISSFMVAIVSACHLELNALAASY